MPTKQTHKGIGDNVAGDKNVYNAYNPDAITNKYLTVIPALPETFIGRQEETEQITKVIYNGNNPLIVRGMGGLGKSTMAKAVIDKIAPRAKYVAWIDASQGLKYGFAAHDFLVNLKIKLSDETQAVGELTDDQFKTVINALFNLEGEGAIVIDNLVQGEDLSLLRSIKSLKKNWNVLITSRFHFDGFKEFILGFLSVQTSIELFYSYYSINKNTALLEEVLRNIGYHTLTNEMLAKTGQKLRLPISVMAERLNQKGIDIASKTNITIDHSEQSVDSIQGYILRIFALGKITAMEEKLLKNFAVISSFEYPSSTMCRTMLFPEHEYTDLEDEINLSISNLIDKGWFIYSGHENGDIAQIEEAEEDKNELFIKMHPLIQEVIRLQLKPTIDDCKHLVFFLTHLRLRNLSSKNLAELWNLKLTLYENLREPKKEIIDLRLSLIEDYIDLGYFNFAIEALGDAESLIKAAEQESAEISAELICHLADLFCKVENYEIASVYIKKAIEKISEVQPYSNYAADLNHTAADIFCKYEKFEEARDFSLKAVQIREKNYPNGDISLAQEYDMLGEIEWRKENEITAEMLENHVEAFRITTEFGKPDSFEVANANIKMAEILSNFSEQDALAKKLLLNGIDIFRNVYSDNAESLFHMETSAAIICTRIGEILLAQQFYQSGIERMERDKRTSGLLFIKMMVRYSKLALTDLKNVELAKEIIDKACHYIGSSIDREQFKFLREARDGIINDLN